MSDFPFSIPTTQEPTQSFNKPIIGCVSDEVISPLGDSDVKLLLDNLKFNTNTSVFSLNQSTNRITIGMKGIYRFYIQVAITNLSEFAESYVLIHVNGSEPNLVTSITGRIDHTQPRFVYTFNGTGYVELDVNDYVEFYYHQGDTHAPDETMTTAKTILELVSTY